MTSKSKEKVQQEFGDEIKCPWINLKAMKTKWSDYMMLMYLYLFFTTFYNKKSEQKSTSVVTCATPTGQRQHCPCFKLNQNNIFFSSKVRAEHIIHMYGIIPANPVFRKAPCQRSMTKIKERVKSKYSFRSLAAKGELPHIFGGWTG